MSLINEHGECFLFYLCEILKKNTKKLASDLIPSIVPASDAGWSSLVARRAHNPKVVGSNPAPATNNKLVSKYISGAGWSSLVARRAHNPKVVGSNPAPATNIPEIYPLLSRGGAAW